MRRNGLILGSLALLLVALAAAAAWQYLLPHGPEAIAVAYPLEGSVFPPEFPPPSIEWQDPSPRARVWKIEVAFGVGTPTALRAISNGEPPRIGEIDPRAVGPTNKPPELTPEQASMHTWRPDAATWDAIKQRSVDRPAVISIAGYEHETATSAVSVGRLTVSTSRDPVGAPVFFRDVPLMPSKTERGVIKPLDQKFVPLINWSVRNVGETKSRIVMTGIHSCANCHSVSRDGSTMGMDVDGPRNDKGLYALFPIRPQATIARENVIAWSSFRGKLGGKLRVAFMSQVSPDARYVVTTIADPGKEQTTYERRGNPQDLLSNYYIANFTDYRFLQVFYPTRGVLAWYSKQTGRLQPLPGADDPRYVHVNPTWSPDGTFLVFARAEARDAYPPGKPLAERANDPNETQIRYDLYRIPFNDGKGGTAEPIAGASANGMSNSFPKITPDGKFLVFVQARNGLLMRPDGKLYIVPVGGGTPRLMRANTPLMNSWHSFSPNGRWMVFTSKSRSPYTQMFLTHVDEEGNDTPAILVEDATAANRAVNIPEFVNIPPDGLLEIKAPVADYYRLIDVASEAMNAGDHAKALPLLQQALDESPGDPFVHNSYGSALAATGRLGEAIPQFTKAVALSPDYPDAHNNLASALAQTGKLDAAIAEFRKAIDQKPEFMEAHAGLGGALAQRGRLDEAIPHLEKASELDPKNPAARANLCLALVMGRRPAEAIVHGEQAVALSNGDPMFLELLGRAYASANRLADAIAVTRRAADVARAAGDEATARAFEGRLGSYQSTAAGSTHP
jgi:Flp pilus assembly protein TadD